MELCFNVVPYVYNFNKIFRHRFLISPKKTAATKNMNVGVAHSDENPNCSWLSGRGGWLAYGFAVCLLHLLVFAIPFIERHSVCTVANVIHNIVRYF